MTHRGLFIFLLSNALIIYCCIYCSIEQIHTAGRVFPHSLTNLLGADSAFEESLCAPIPILVKGRKRKKTLWLDWFKKNNTISHLGWR